MKTFFPIPLLGNVAADWLIITAKMVIQHCGSFLKKTLSFIKFGKT